MILGKARKKTKIELINRLCISQGFIFAVQSYFLNTIKQLLTSLKFIKRILIIFFFNPLF